MTQSKSAANSDCAVMTERYAIRGRRDNQEWLKRAPKYR